MKKWDQRFLTLAAHFATWSKDPSTQVGAVIVDHDRRIIGEGFNGFPRGVGDHEERYLEKAVKYKLVVHAEANAILNAVKSVRHCSLYATKAPCTECVKLIIQSGINEVISPEYDVIGTWGEDAHYARQMLSESGVVLRHE